ncbi:ArsR/SmtB family transcription factor [Halovenus marina]|uniref:ArsR/SmtB family transcription factor n=1 Tax=Halovenus marina TaxID=3396621 RepID=UPI003F57A558
MTTPTFVERDDPEAVFSTLSDTNRVDILRALWEAEGHEATFSDLREAVGMRDSGQFNYHLDKLVGRLVTRTDEGYELTRTGMQVVGAVEAGTYTTSADVDSIPVSAPCGTCGGTQTLSYENQTVLVECEDCGIHMAVGVPPSVIAGYDREEIPAVASRYLQSKLRQIYDGFCLYCDGAIEPTVDSLSAIIDVSENVPEDIAAEIKDSAFVQFECSRCGGRVPTTPRITLLHHPAVIAFYYDHGISLSEESVWQFADLSADRQRLVETDPVRVRLTYTVDGDTLTLVVDGSLDVVEIES